MIGLDTAKSVFQIHALDVALHETLGFLAILRIRCT